MLIAPLIVLAAVASYVGGNGLGIWWFVPNPFQYIIAAAMHGSYVLRSPRTSPALAALSWCTCLYWSSAGMRTFVPGYPLISATLLEATCLLLSKPDPWIPVSERIALWRREQARIALQLQMSEGILPWARRVVRQAVCGRPETAAGYDHLRLAAILADAENRLNTRLARLVMPEHLRQTIVTNAARITSRIETSAAERAVEIDRLVLEAAAACRDECAQMEQLSANERRVLAERCEEALLELAHH